MVRIFGSVDCSFGVLFGSQFLASLTAGAQSALSGDRGGGIGDLQRVCIKFLPKLLALGLLGVR